MTNVNRSCPICQHRGAHPIYGNKMAPIEGLDMSYALARCGACGFYFADTLPAEDTCAKYYQSVSKYDFARAISETDLARIEAAVGICADIVPNNATVIDLGCGYGALLSRFKAAGYTRLHGIDPAPNSASQAHQLFGLDHVRRGTMADAPHLLNTAEADLVCIMAVLEHLPRVREDLQVVLTTLKHGCRILVEVPALERFDGVHGEPFGEFSLEHVQFFSENSLNNLFATLGARPLATRFLGLPSVRSGSLFAVYEMGESTGGPLSPSPEDDAYMKSYLDNCRANQIRALARIADGRLGIYGAGSHTARLLSNIEANHEIVAVFDGNPNLHGKTIGNHVIRPPAALESMPDLPLLVSSFNSQAAIASNLRRFYPNRLIRMYANPGSR